MIEAQNTLLPNGLERFLVRGKIFFSEMATQFPAVAAGIQVIHCKNPKCANFGLPPNAAPSHPLGRPTKGTVLATPKPGDYLLSGRGRGAGSSLPYL